MHSIEQEIEILTEHFVSVCGNHGATEYGLIKTVDLLKN